MIQALDRESVHKICSGQVVVDLATAVKEMVENALDAGASHIDIKLKDMGADMIEVADNGGGIDPANHSGIALKHCTSKLESFGDLNSITSFGFRGEALNALCELSESMTISTMQIDQAVGTLLSFEQDGTLKDKSVVARTPGTTVSVRKLFSRLPVRRSEFVRTIKKHFQKMVKIVQTYAVISVGVKIMISNVNSNGSRQTVLSTPSSTKLIDNISNIFGAKFATSLIPVTIEVDVSAADDRENIKESSYPKVDHNQPASGVEPEQNEDDLPQQRDKENNFYSDGAALDTTRKTNRVVKISGFVSKVGEGVGRSDNDRQFVFCNGRPVDMPRISRAMNEVWRRYEMKQKPAFILCFRIPDGLFDVNLTPDKREVLVCQERTIVEHLRDYVDRIYAPVRSQMPLNQGMPAAVSAATSTCVSGFTGGMVTTSSSCASYQSSEGIETDQQRNATITGLKRKATEDTVTLDRFLTSYSTATNDAAPEDPGLSKEHMTEDPLSPSSSLSLPSSPGNRLRGDNTAVRADAYEAVANEIGKRSADEGSGAAGEKATTPLKAVLWMSPVERERLQDSQTKKQQRVLALTEVLEATKSRPETASQVAMAVQSENEGWDGHTTDIVHPLPPAGNEQQQQPPALEPRTHSWSFDPLAVLQCLQKRRRVNDASLASTAGLGSVSSSEDTSAADATSSNDGETGTGTGTGTGNGTGTGSGTSPANGSLSDINSVAGDEAIDSTDGAAVDMRSAGGAATPSDRRVLTKDAFAHMRIIGQFNLGFIIAEYHNDLYILDQHACDEKYRFELLQRSTTIHQQPLIHPLTVESSAALELTIEEHLPVFEANGFKIRVDRSAPCGQRVKLLAAPFSKAVHFGVDDVNELASMIAEEEGFGGAGGSYADDSGSSVNQRTSKSYLLLKNDAISDTSSSSNEEKELGARPAEYQMSSDEPTPGSTQQTTSTAAATTATTTRMIKKRR